MRTRNVLPVGAISPFGVRNGPRCELDLHGIAVELVARVGEGGDDAVPVALAFEPHVIALGLDP
jgi:hypothetical protein